MRIVTNATKIALGALATALLAWGNHALTAKSCIEDISSRARAELDANGGKDVNLSFQTASGAWTRHPTLGGGAGLADDLKAKLLGLVGGVAGVGNVKWGDGAPAAAAPAATATDAAPAATAEKVAECQGDVNGLLTGKTIAFKDGSAYVSPSNGKLLDDLATALKPCAGTVVEVQGHTSSTGSAQLNNSLSQARADAVRAELVKRGLTEAQLTAKGYGSTKPLNAANTADGANRRIEFAIGSAGAITPVDGAAAATTPSGGE